MRRAACLTFAMAFAPSIARAECEVAITGAVTAKGKDKGGPSSMTTDYWYTPEELDKEIERIVRRDYVADIEARIAARKERPQTFVLVCRLDGVTVELAPMARSRPADIPFASKRYVIKPAASAKAGEIVATIVAGRTSFSGGTGTLDVTRFDTERFAGTFKLEADGIAVVGSFDYACHFPTKICLGSRPRAR